MGQVLHGGATTTEAIRRAIQHSQDNLRTLAKSYGINQKTVAKWKRRTAVTDLPTGPKDAKSTVLSLEDEAIIPVLKARMNADLHMAEDLKNTGKGNLFVIFGEPDIDLLTEKDGKLRVKVNGVDVFKPQTGEVISDGADGIACWFIDTDYNEESFYVRHAYFLGANDPYSALKTTLKAEIDPEA
jgi:hypothetical protein